MGANRTNVLDEEISIIRSASIRSIREIRVQNCWSRPEDRGAKSRSSGCFALQDDSDVSRSHVGVGRLEIQPEPEMQTCVTWLCRAGERDHRRSVAATQPDAA